MMSILKKTFSAVLFLAFVFAANAQDMTLEYAMHNEEWATAATKLEALTKANPADMNNWLTLSNVFLAQEQKDKAKMALEKVVAGDDSHLTMVAEGRLALLSGDVGAADGAFAKAAKKSRGKKADVLRAIGESYIYGKTRDLKKAEALLKEAYNKHSKDYDILMALAYCYKVMPKGGDAVLHYEFAQAVKPNDNLPGHMIAKVFWGTRNYPKYEEHLKKVVTKSPNYYPAVRDLADYLYFKKRIPEAVGYYEQLSKIPNPMIEDKMVLANSYFFMKKYDDMAPLIDKILKEDPSKNYLRRLRGYVLYEQGKELEAAGDTEGAAKKYAEADAIMEDYFKTVAKEKIIDSDYEYRGLIKEKIGKDSLAIVYFKEAIKMTPSKYELYGNIGTSYYARKNYCSAADAFALRIDSLEAAADFIPSANDYYTLGICHYYCKDGDMHYEKAEAAFRKVTELAPTSTAGFKQLAKTQGQFDPSIPDDETSPAYAPAVQEFGKAKETHEKIIEIGAEDLEKNRKDMINSYEYLVYMYYLKNDKPNFFATASKLLAIDPSNETASQLTPVMSGEAAPVDGNK